MPGCWRYWPGNGQGAGLKVREGENRPGSAPPSPGDLSQDLSLPICVGVWGGADVLPLCFFAVLLYLPTQMEGLRPREGRDPCHTAQGHPAEGQVEPESGLPSLA